MLKSLSAALLAVAMLTAPAFAAGPDDTAAAPAAATVAATPAPMAHSKVAPKAKAAHASRAHHRAVHHKPNKHSSLRGHHHVAKLGAQAHARQRLSKAQLRPAAAKRG